MSGGRARSALGTLWHELTAAQFGARHGEPLKLWRVSDGALLQTLAGENNDVRSVAMSPDGKLIASASEGQTIRIWRFLEKKPFNAVRRLDSRLNRERNGLLPCFLVLS